MLLYISKVIWICFCMTFIYSGSSLDLDKNNMDMDIIRIQ